MAGETTAALIHAEVNGGRQLSYELMREDHSMIDGEEKPSRYVKPKRLLSQPSRPLLLSSLMMAWRRRGLLHPCRRIGHQSKQYLILLMPIGQRNEFRSQLSQWGTMFSLN